MCVAVSPGVSTTLGHRSNSSRPSSRLFATSFAQDEGDDPSIAAAKLASVDAVLIVDVHVSSAVFDLLPADLTKDPIPVVPVLFTQVGGAVVFRGHQSHPGLFAVDGG